MKINKNLLLIILMFVAFWLQFYLGGIHYLILIMIVIYMTFNLSIWKSVIQNKNILILLFIILISYIVNLGNFDTVALNHAKKTGNYDTLMYGKVVFNSLVLIFYIIFSFSFGYKIAQNNKLLFSFFNIINFIFFINSLIVILGWLIQTGGVISRYNFVSPIDNSPSLSATFAVWGVLITLAQKKGSTYKTIFLAIFILNLIIVITRLTQVIFLISVLYFYILNIKDSNNKVVKYILFSFIGFFLLILLSGLFVTVYSNYYSTILSKGSYDILARQSSMIAAVKLFIDNPVIGIGYGMFGPYNVISFRGFILESTHNGLLSVLSELGIIGILGTLLLFYNIIKVTNSEINKNLEENLKKFRIVCIINLRLTILTFFLANFILLPPPSERIYYFSCVFMWIMYGVVHFQYYKYKEIELIN